MAKRIIIAGIAAGVALFMWSFVSHVLLPLGEIGIRSVPNEQPVMDALRAGITEDGFYFFPGLDPSRRNDEAAMKAWDEKARRGPAGILIYQVHGAGAMAPGQLMTELGSNIALALVAAFIVSLLAGGFAQRAGVVTLIGLISGLDVYVSYWNWFKFPTNYTLGVMFDQLVGFAIMGAVIAAIVKAGGGPE